MSKKSTLQKGFNSLLKSTEVINDIDNSNIISVKKQTGNTVSKKNNQSKNLNVQTAKRLNIQEPKHLDADFFIDNNTTTIKNINKSKAKYLNLKKCTLYLPQEIMDTLGIEKIKSKKDLSELTAEAIIDYLKNKGYDNFDV